MAQVLSTSDVDRIATLARLELSDDERARFAPQLTAILAYADQVAAVDTSGVDTGIATSLPVAVPVQLREDELRPSLERDALLEQAPVADRTAGLFTVPRVLGS